MEDYLKDKQFLYELDSQQLKVQYIKIILLNKDESPIKEIEGSITSGSLNINGASAVRRTINLSLQLPLQEKIDNDMGLNKKIKIFIGYKNPILEKINEYGKIIWFPCGIFLITSLSISKGLNSQNVSISGRDKMALLDGTIGGKLPATVYFSEIYQSQIDNNGEENIKILHPTIYQIIRESVQQYGEELGSNIFINDLDNTAKLLVKYIGIDPVYFNQEFTSLSYTLPKEGKYITCVKNQDIGYKETPMTYPGELVLSAGDNIVSMLNKICSILGSYEFFYDVEGKFIFQKKRMYSNDFQNITQISLKNYVPIYKQDSTYQIKNFSTITSLNYSPKYDNIKNDFIIWGKKKNRTGIETDIRYHLIIDEKPELDLAKQYMYQEFTIENATVNDYNKFSQELHDVAFGKNKIVLNKKTVKEEKKWFYNNKETDLMTWGITTNNKLIEKIIIELKKISFYNEEQTNLVLLGDPSDDWREEIYRRSFNNPKENDRYAYYYPELRAEWRKLYDPMETKWINGWNPDVKDSPTNLTYWFDFIENPEIDKYAVYNIGRRMEVLNTESENIFNSTPADIIFYRADETTEEQKTEWREKGWKYFQLQPGLYDLFVASSTKASLFDQMRELLYQHLNYNTQISLTCLPKYHLEPNTILQLYDTEKGEVKNYNIISISLPLTSSGLMNITAIEIFNKI